MKMVGQQSSFFEQWTSLELVEAMRNYGAAENVVQALSENIKTGKDAEKLTLSDFKDMNLRFGDWLDFNNFKNELLQSSGDNRQSVQTGNQKIFNDPIHGNIHLHPVCLAIIDTPQFQRLRDLKQLGLVYFVYPGAAHNRFEHSLGVCHLAGQYVRALRENQPELGITDQDVLCVEIAGLCHDLGHGPFSHMFDQMFIPTTVPDSQWTHEQGSMDMFDHLVRENGLDKEGGIFEKFGLGPIDLVFIKELIKPQLIHENMEWPHRGRSKEKSYLYEIVANKRNSIDVDKWDYLARDCHQLGIANNFDHTRFIKFARVMEMNGVLQICLREKEVLNLYNMFSTRYTLHKVAYQHPVASSMAIMVAHALIKANDHVVLTGTGGKKLRMSDSITDMAAYSQLTDNVIFTILETEGEHPDLREARDLVQRLLSRDLYTCVFQSSPIDPVRLSLLQKDDKQICQEIVRLSEDRLRAEDIIVEIVRLDFGMNEQNPVEKINVYSKQTPWVARTFSKEEASRILASNYTEVLLRVYCCHQRKIQPGNKWSSGGHFMVISGICKQWFADSALMT